MVMTLWLQPFWCQKPKCIRNPCADDTVLAVFATTHSEILKISKNPKCKPLLTFDFRGSCFLEFLVILKIFASCLRSLAQTVQEISRKNHRWPQKLAVRLKIFEKIEFAEKYGVQSKNSKKQLPLKSKVGRGLHLAFQDIISI